MINGVTMKLHIDEELLRALREDITSEDVTTNAVMPEPRQGQAELICKATGLLAGREVFQRVFTLLDESAVVEWAFQDGDEIQKGQRVAVVRGDIRALLSGERVGRLNYLQRMCGIATYTRDLVKKLTAFQPSC